MEKILVMDAKDYDEGLDEILRVAVRGIIFVDGKLLLINSSFGELKFPGGGKEGDESDEETLIRETLEETGYHVIPESIRPFGEVVEKRMSVHEEKIWHQINRYYFCDVTAEQGMCSYTENEVKYGFHQVWHTLDDAIRINEETLQKEGAHAWNQREYNVLKLIREYVTRGTSEQIHPRHTAEICLS